MDKNGASFDMLIKDLDEAGKQAADYVLKNLPEKKLSATALLIPKLPKCLKQMLKLFKNFVTVEF